MFRKKLPQEPIQENTITEEEFFTPVLGLELEPYLAAEDLQGIHHLARYHWASLVIQADPPGKMLDIACGAGYGSFLMAEKFPGWQVTGADYDARSIIESEKNYERPNLGYLQGNMITWKGIRGGQTVDLGSYRVILSFDTVEHIDHQEIAFMNIADRLADDGMFLFSTPISFPSTNFSPEWAAHKIEYGATDLKNILRRYFGEVLVPEEGTLPAMEFWTDFINQVPGRYVNIANPVVCRKPIRV